jgi:cardiolipin synthase
VLAATEARLVAIVGVVLLAVAVVGILWPLVLVVPLAVILIWLALALLVRAHKLRTARRSQGLPPQRIAPAAPPDPEPKTPQ